MTTAPTTETSSLLATQPAATTSTTTTTTSPRLRASPYVTGLTLLLQSWIVLGHFVHVDDAAPSFVRKLLARGDYPVTTYMVLSGAATRSAYTGAPLSEYLLRRLVPVFVANGVVLVAAEALIWRDFTSAAFWRSMFLAEDRWDVNPLLAAWNLTLFWKCWLLFPLLGTTGGRRGAVVVGAVFAVGALAACPDGAFWSAKRPHVAIAQFVAGTRLGDRLERVANEDRGGARRRRWWLAESSLVLLVGAAAFAPCEGGEISRVACRAHPLHGVLSAGLGTLLACGLVYGLSVNADDPDVPSPLRRLTGSAVVLTLTAHRAMFAVFLLQRPVHIVIPNDAPTFFVALWCAAHLTGRFVYVPVSTHVKTLCRSRRETTTTTTRDAEDGRVRDKPIETMLSDTVLLVGCAVAFVVYSAICYSCCEPGWFSFYRRHR